MIMQLPVALIPRSRPPRHTKEDRGEKKQTPGNRCGTMVCRVSVHFSPFFLKNQ